MRKRRWFQAIFKYFVHAYAKVLPPCDEYSKHLFVLILEYQAISINNEKLKIQLNILQRTEKILKHKEKNNCMLYATVPPPLCL